MPETKDKYIIAAEDRTNKAIKSARSNMRRLNNEFKAVGKTIGRVSIAAGAVGAAFGVFAKKSLEVADQIGKTSRAIGLNVEAYQELRFAAERAGVETSQFNSNMTAFVKRVGEARAGTGPLVSFLKKYDETLLSAIQNTQTQEQAFNLIADAIDDAATATDRAAIANAAFSRAGVNMVNLMDQGADGMRDLRREARELGIVMSKETIANSEEAIDKLTNLTNVIRLKLTAAIAEHAPTIGAFFDDTLKFFKEVSKYVDNIQAIGTSIGEFMADAEGFRRVSALDLVNEKIAKVREQILENAEIINDKGFLGTGLGASTAEEIEAARKRIADLRDELSRLFEVRERINMSGSRTGRGATENQPRATAGSRPDDSNLFGSTAAFEEKEGAAEARQREIEKMREHAQQRFAVIQESLKSERQIELEAFQARRQFLLINMQLGLIDRQSANRALEQEQERHLERMKAITSRTLEETIQMERSAQTQRLNTVLGTMQQITQGAAQQSKAMFEINKAAALAQAAINIPSAASGAYEWGVQIGGPPLGAAMAALAVGAQIAKLQQIQQSQFTGTAGSVPPSAAGTGAGSVVGTTPINQPQTNERGRGPQTAAVVNIYGDVFDGATMDKFLEQFSDLVNNHDKVVINRNSRQAFEISRQTL